MFYGNRKSLVYNVLGVFIYFILDKYVCIDYFFQQKENKLYVS